MSYTCPRCDRTSDDRIDAEARYCGHCHTFESQLLCFRVYVEGDLLSQEWVGPGDDVAAVAERQGAMTHRAEAAGLDWTLEVYDPERNRAVCVARRPIGPRTTSVPFDERLGDLLAS